MKYYMALSGITENCIYDASFIKLRELSFGYNFPTKWIRKNRFVSLVFLSRRTEFVEYLR